jgi:gliding motility-associated-like protein
MIITENTNGPLVDLGPDILECEGTVVTLNPGISGVSYLWQDGSSTPEYMTSVSGTFILQVSNSCGMDKDTVNVEISGVAPQPDLGLDTLMCEGETLLLNANPDPGTLVVWQDGSTAPTFIVTDPGTYSLAASNRCGSANDTILIAYEAAPVAFSLGPDTTLCPGEFILLTAPQTNANITWQDGSHGVSLVADHALLYTLQLTNDCGTSSDELLLSYDERMPVVDIHPIPWCEGDVITLDASQSFNAHYLWYDGSITPVIQVDAPGVYGVEVSTDCQSVQQDIEVVLSNDCKNEIYVPGVFSPNGDGINDTWSIYAADQDAELVSLSIFDRWGGIIYYCSDKLLNDSNAKWDGRMKGKDMEGGVYVFIAVVRLSNGNSRSIKGDITLIR